MKLRMLSLIPMLVIVLSIAACAQSGQAAEAPEPTGPSTQGSAVEDLASLVNNLRAGGADVEPGEPVEQAFFTVTGQIIRVNGADVQVFEYESAEAMQADAAQVSADGGSIGTNMVMWVEPPHFFKSGRVLVLYVGEDASVLDLLKGALGEQFAGR
jgi:hypothetical protein